MSAAALAERLMKRAENVPGADFVPCALSRKQQERQQGTPQANDFNGKTGVCALVPAVPAFSERVGKQDTESRPDQAANDAQAPAPATTTPPDWRQADAAYLRHHFTCPSCCAAGHGRGDRCTTGADLWASYEAACEADRTTNTKIQRRSAR